MASDSPGQHLLIQVVCLLLAGCASPAPKVVLSPPEDYPATWRSKKIYNTSNVLVYAANDRSAAEADAWVREVRDYIKSKYQGDLEKGVVLVMEPGEEPIVNNAADELALERNPEIMRTQPRHLKSILELRAKLSAEGVPEKPMVRGATIPIPNFKFEQLHLAVPKVAWAVAAPSHELAIECGIEVGAAALRKKRPDLTEEQARRAASIMKGSLAKPFEMVRGNPVFEMWVQRQDGWTYEAKRDAVNGRIRYTLRSHGLPQPKDEDFDW